MRLISIIFLSLILFNSFGQKQLILKEVEEQMQKNNLLLLAEQYNITASQANLIQAKIWEQPYISAEFNAINPQDNRIFDAGRRGEKQIAIQQLIYLGGKKRNEINYAKSNVSIAQLEFEQLLRNLKYTLQKTFYNVYFDKQKSKTIDSQISIIDTLVSNYNTQAKKGNVSLHEVVRLQSLVLNLKNEKNNLQKDIIEAQQDLALLTGISDSFEPLVNETDILSKYQTTLISKDQILAAALENNIEYLSAIKMAESQENYLKWQKSLSIPGVTAGLSYDQRGGSFSNQVDLTIGIPLPLWNTNKGNIKMAEAKLNQSNMNKEYKKMELQTKIETYWQQWQQQLNQFNNIDKSTINNLESVYDGMILNFKKRNITMLEFTDFIESYNQSFIQLNEIKKSLIQSGLNINYITNKEIF